MKIQRDIFEFIKPAKTSRGEYTSKPHFRLTYSKNNVDYTGEIAPLPDLSIDGKVDYQTVFEQHNIQTWEQTLLFTAENKTQFPALAFAVDSISQQLSGTKSEFEKGKSIKINGLIWMNNLQAMEIEALEKARYGFSCLKFKVGALDHDGECKLIEKIRKQHPALTIRLDANGGFEDEPLERISDFSKFNIHSIEQPIKVGNWEWMQEICAKSAIKVALDEELIGVFETKKELLKIIKPAYLVLKPTLLGGFLECNQWVAIARKMNIDWWATSALEGNIGLLAIANWVSNMYNPLHQGLGTGALYKSNYKAPFYLQKEELFYGLQTF